MIRMALIPARYAATRFPFKLMQLLGNKTVIRNTYENTKATGLFDDVIVVTDHEIIFQEINSHGGKVMMSKKNHDSGSDRIAEAIENMQVDVVLNVQGDEPFVSARQCESLLKCFERGDDIQVASLMKPITDMQLVNNPNIVKLVVDNQNKALYFSRSPVPYNRDKETTAPYFEHIGVYAYRKEALMAFTKWPTGKLEQAEKLEQLRYLENGVNIHMVETTETAVKIDVPADLEIAEAYWQQLHKKV